MLLSSPRHLSTARRQHPHALEGEGSLDYTSNSGYHDPRYG